MLIDETKITPKDRARVGFALNQGNLATGQITLQALMGLFIFHEIVIQPKTRYNISSREKKAYQYGENGRITCILFSNLKIKVSKLYNHFYLQPVYLCIQSFVPFRL